MTADRVRYTVDFHLHVDAERNTVDVLKALKPSKRQECMRQWMALGRAVEQLLEETSGQSGQQRQAGHNSMRQLQSIMQGVVSK